MSGIQLIDTKLLDLLSNAARTAPRLRKNHNLHQSYADPCQRLLNAVEPGSYVRPHRHLEQAKPECFVLLRGRMAVLLFADHGEVTQIIHLSKDSGCLAVDIPAGAWHSLVSFETGTVFFETKPGPYHALSDKDFAPWAPAEDSPDSEDYRKFLEKIAGKL